MRRDERERHRVETPDEHGASVRQVVGGRSGRRCTDQTVTREHAEVFSADRVAELDHSSGRRARREDVVHGRPAFSADPYLERRQLDDREVSLEGPPKPFFQLLMPNRGQEADTAEVDTDHRYAGAEKAVEGLQHRAVTAN